MKKLFFLFVACALATTASAQFINSVNAGTNSGSSGNVFSKMSTDDYNRIYFSYNPTAIKWSEDQSYMEDLYPMTSGLSFGYLHGSSLSQNIPLFLEYGANVQYSWGKWSDAEEDESYETKMNLYSVNIPVNLALKLQFNECALTPYLGLNFRVNAAGKCTDSYEYDGYYDYIEDTEEYNLFDKDDMDDYPAKRFQAGINFGVGFTYKALYLGVGHVSDFSKFFDDGDDYFGKMGVTTLTVGFNF